jgi:transcriptional regulator with XRE-family HTH domain
MRVTETLEKKTLKQWREYLSISQRELAEMARCAHVTVSALETGMLAPNCKAGERILAVMEGFGISESTIDIAEGIKEAKREIEESGVWVEDGFRATTPKRTLEEWREARNLSQRDLSILAGFSIRSIQLIERGEQEFVRPRNRQKLAKALRVRSNKLILPGDKVPTQTDIKVEESLRADLRGARRALHNAYVFMLDDSNITFRAQETRDALMPDIRRELKGT